MAGLGDMFGQSLATVNGQKPRNSDRIQAGQPLNLRGAFEAATNIPVVGDALSGGMAMYDAAKGDYGSAAMNALGVLPFVSGTFIGKGAKTFDFLKAADAEKRIAAGDDVRKVWKETGTFKGPDGHLRQEIDDSSTRFTDSAIKDLRNANGKRQSQIFANDGAYAAYPESANIWTTKSVGDKAGDRAAYHGGEMGERDMISLGLPKRGIPDMEELRGSNLHELQHAIQEREGWAKGGSPEGMQQEYNQARARLAFLEKDPDYIAGQKKMDSLWDRVFNVGDVSTENAIAQEAQIISGHPALAETRSVMGALRQLGGPTMEDSHKAYRRLAGEAEARATQSRMNMNMDQRLNTYPLDSYDVPIDQLIIRGNTPMGKAMSEARPLTEFEQRHLIAQKNAALPVEQGGLGLPPNNTAMDRARAMEFDTDRNLYHGAKNIDQTQLIASKGGELGPGSYVTTDPELAKEYARNGYGHSYPDGGGIFPVVTRNLEDIQRKDWVNARGKKFDQLTAENNGEWDASLYDKGHDLMRLDAENKGKFGYYNPSTGGENQGVVFDPANIRSRFAAFDPMRRHEADLLGNIDPRLLGAMGIGSVGAATAATQLPEEYKTAIANAFEGN